MSHTKEEVLAIRESLKDAAFKNARIKRSIDMAIDALAAYAALLGDGPVGYACPKSMQGYTLGAWADFMAGDQSEVRSVPLYAAPPQENE